jgi:hypothetical protein
MERRMKQSPAEKDVMRAKRAPPSRRRHLYGTTSAAVPDFAARRSTVLHIQTSFRGARKRDAPE